MATRKRKPWNADKVLFPKLQDQPKPEVPEHLGKLDKVHVGHSTGTHYEQAPERWQIRRIGAGRRGELAHRRARAVGTVAGPESRVG